MESAKVAQFVTRINKAKNVSDEKMFIYTFVLFSCSEFISEFMPTSEMSSVF